MLTGNFFITAQIVTDRLPEVPIAFLRNVTSDVAATVARALADEIRDDPAIELWTFMDIKVRSESELQTRDVPLLLRLRKRWSQVFPEPDGLDQSPTPTDRHGGDPDADLVRHLQKRALELLEQLDPSQHAPTGEPGDQWQPEAPATRHRDSERTERFTWIAKAMILVREHPDWSDSKIAEEVEIHKSQLSRCREFQIAAAQARGTKEDRAKGTRTFDPDSGLHDVEAAAPLESCHPSDYGQPIPGSKYFSEVCAECGEPLRVKEDQVGKNPLCDACKK